jgi:hypothetical protein
MEDERIDVAGVIIGLPRTGGTILQRMLASSFHKASYGAHWSKRFRQALHKLIAVRAGAAGSRFIDVQYQDTVRHPIDVSRRLMQAMGLPFTIADEAAIRACLAANERDNRPPHRYTAEEFGLTRKGMATDFSFYTDL